MFWIEYDLVVLDVDCFVFDVGVVVGDYGEMVVVIVFGK